MQLLTEGFTMQSRRKFIRNISLGTAAVALAPYDILGNQKLAKGSDFIKLTILHTNDMHSHVDAFPTDDRKYPGLGGMNRIAEMVNKVREKEGEILLLDAGDIFQGTPYFNIFGGEVEFKLMSQMKYDAATMGNHDFDNGMDGFNNMLPHADFPFLCANYDFSDTILNNKTKPYQIFNKRGLKIGIFGVGVELDGLVDSRLCKGVVYNDPIKIANKYASLLKNEEKCDLVVCLSHLGYKYDYNKVSDNILAQETSNIDCIIGGHTHTFLDKAETFTNKSGKKVLVNQAGWAALRLGRMDFFFSRNGKEIDFEATISNSKNYASF